MKNYDSETVSGLLELGTNCTKNKSVAEENPSERNPAETTLPAEATLHAALTFDDAVPIWQDLRLKRWNLKEKTHELHNGYLKALRPYFKSLQLKHINERHIREYQLARAANTLRVTNPDGSITEIHPWKRKPGNKLIGAELNALSMILDVLGLWAAIKPFCNSLPRKRWSPRHKFILDEDEEIDFFDRASRDPEIMFSFCIALFSSHTTATGCELRGLRLENLHWREPKYNDKCEDINPSFVDIPEDAVKNDDRPRIIPLTPTAKWALQQLYRRALQLGCTEPQHFLFPFRIAKNRYDPTRRASRWFVRNNWAKLRNATGYKNIQPHDMRHLCITKMLERGAKPEAVREIAGHVSVEMMEYYSHFRRREKYAALILIDAETEQRKKAPQSVKWDVTNKTLTGS